MMNGWLCTKICLKAVVPKLVWTVTQIKVAIKSDPPTKIIRNSCRKFIFQWLLIIQNNNMVWFCVTPRRIAYYPQFGNHCFKVSLHASSVSIISEMFFQSGVNCYQLTISCNGRELRKPWKMNMCFVFLLLWNCRHAGLLHWKSKHLE